MSQHGGQQEPHGRRHHSHRHMRPRLGTAAVDLLSAIVVILVAMSGRVAAVDGSSNARLGPEWIPLVVTPGAPGGARDSIAELFHSSEPLQIYHIQVQ